MTYYGVALNEKGQKAQVVCVREQGARRQWFTGVTYKTVREAVAETARLNGCAK
jgi:hypothetical protein